MRSNDARWGMLFCKQCIIVSTTLCSNRQSHTYIICSFCRYLQSFFDPNESNSSIHPYRYRSLTLPIVEYLTLLVHAPFLQFGVFSSRRAEASSLKAAVAALFFLFNQIASLVTGQNEEGSDLGDLEKNLKMRVSSF